MHKKPCLLEPADVSTRPRRRRAVSLVITELEMIRAAEEGYLSRIPPNLQGGEAALAADDSVSYLIDAICTLSDAY